VVTVRPMKRLSTTSRLLAVLLGSALLAGAVPSMALAMPTLPTLPKPPKTKIVRLQMDLAGYVEARTLHNTKSDCWPGVSYIQTNRFEFETGTWVNSVLSNTSMPGTDGVISSAGSVPSGSAAVEGLITDFSTSNYCDRPPDPEPSPPACAKTHGKIMVGLTEGATAMNGDLPTLAGKSLLVTITRVGGGVDPTTCVGVPAGSIIGADADNSGVTTSYAPGVSETLTTGLTAIKVFNLKKGKTFRRTIVIDGPCDAVNVKSGANPAAVPNPGGLNADSDCWMTGKVVFSLRRVG
jgi:hypothetical protein